jgi:hypothetical protein
MEARFIKDLALALIFICLFAFAVKDYTIYSKVNGIADKSKYADISVNEELLTKIQVIESSIRDRKSFTFNVPTDPLRQDPVIKDKLDRLQAWEDMVNNMVRVAATFVDEDNQKVAVIAYHGASALYRVGDTIAGRRIDDIRDSTVYYTYGGVRSSMTVQPIPPKPVDLEPASDFTDYNY